MPTLFNEPNNIFKWTDIKTFLLRNQYNEVLNRVVEEYFTHQYTTSELPNFLNVNDCLTLTNFDEKCGCITRVSPVDTMPDDSEAVEVTRMRLRIAKKDLEDALSANKLDKKVFEKFFIRDNELPIDNKILKDKTYAGVENRMLDFNKQIGILSELITSKKIIGDSQTNIIEKLQLKKNEELAKFYASQEEYTKNPTDNTDLNEAARNLSIAIDELKKVQLIDATRGVCRDNENDIFCRPRFFYSRALSLLKPIKDQTGNPVPDNFFDFQTNSLTVGAVLWLYYYERMGIFKILVALLDDYNYRGKYTLSGSRSNDYSALMDMICTWHRLGISSNLRDRVCLYQRTLGVSIENNLGIESERNTGFMTTFNKLLDYMLEYYKDKRLAAAINGGGQSRSSVATQTSIKDTMEALRQQLEPFQYGRNQINTFLGIATVHATICLLHNVRKEIGIPDQYERPQEFIPAAYDILVAKRPMTLNETNRFLVYDNCATYGYRILTDIETIDLTQVPTSPVGGTFDLWLNDVEGLVEGYRNAYSTLPEKVEAVV